jgi:hypothetical protein
MKKKLKHLKVRLKNLKSEKIKKTNDKGRNFKLKNSFLNIKNNILKSQNTSNVQVNGFLFWTPRIISILFILFLSIFSFDVFDSCEGFFQCAGALFMHSIPSLLLLVFLVVAWKYELVGAIGFFGFGLFYIITMAFNAPSILIGISWALIIAGPAIIVGVLFFWDWKKKRG